MNNQRTNSTWKEVQRQENEREKNGFLSMSRVMTSGRRKRRIDVVRLLFLLLRLLFPFSVEKSSSATHSFSDDTSTRKRNAIEQNTAERKTTDKRNCFTVKIKKTFWISRRRAPARKMQIYWYPEIRSTVHTDQRLILIWSYCSPWKRLLSEEIKWDEKFYHERVHASTFV